MTQHEDRDKVLAAFGGKKGLIDSGIPAVIFLVVFNVGNGASWRIDQKCPDSFSHN
jgi:hypothetical protein